MTQKDPKNATLDKKAAIFFERADEVAETGNWDFAIELYVEGVKRVPNEVARGHKKLRDVALKRKVQGGKAPGMGDKLKHRQGKDPVENLGNAAYMLAKDPGSLKHMENLLRAAQRLEANDTVQWICEIILESQRQQGAKADLRILKIITDAFDDIEEFGLAIQSCEMARLRSPNDSAIQEKLSALSANYTIKKAGYGDKSKDFTEGVVDLAKQKELIEKDKLTQGKDYLQQQAERAKAEYLADPQVPGKVNAYVDALCKLEDEGAENEAIDVLTKAHKDTGAYQFKMKVGDIKIRQLTRQYRKLLNEKDLAGAKEQARKQLVFELQEFAERAINYPTDLSLKYELGRRQLLAKQYDEAIGSLQQAQRDPKRHVMALNYLGQAFSAKSLFREAANTYSKALESEVSEERAKELRYNYGDVLEKMGDLEKAREEFSTVAQLDYNYKDVRQRLEAIAQKQQ